MTPAIATKKIETRLNEEITSFIKQSGLHENTTSGKSRITFDEFLKNKLLVISAIRAGMPWSMFELIQQFTPFSEKDWAEILDISQKSLQRYKASANHSFKSIHSEKIIEMAEVTHIGIDVFDDLEKFKLWLSTPSFALGNHKPVELLRDSYGKEMVIAELVRISHGVLV